MPRAKNAALLEAAAGENGQHGSQTRSGTAGVRGGFNHFLQLHDVNARQGNLYPRRTTTIIASVNKIRRLSSGTFMEFANADIMVL